MKNLQKKIMRSFIVHYLILAGMNAAVNSIFDHILERYVPELGSPFLIGMTVLNLLIVIGFLILISRNFYKELQVFLADEVKEQTDRDHLLYSCIAHDLKTPLTVIKAYAGALSDGKIEENKKVETYQLIEQKTDDTVLLLSDLLTYSGLLKHADDSPPEVPSIDLASVLNDLVADLYPMFEAQAILPELEIQDKVISPMDVSDFKRIAENLISNAIKHNPPGTALKLGLQTHDKTVRFYVADSGRTIDDERLFEAFYTGDPSRTPGQGHGLGLAIVSRLVQKYDGKVSIAQPFEDYTKAFVVDFPL
jgi:signal transduction histidine kinase